MWTKYVNKFYLHNKRSLQTLPITNDIEIVGIPVKIMAFLLATWHLPVSFHQLEEWMISHYIIFRRAHFPQFLASLLSSDDTWLDNQTFSKSHWCYLIGQPIFWHITLTFSDWMKGSWLLLPFFFSIVWLAKTIGDHLVHSSSVRPICWNVAGWS